jgi:hypothetical protein
VTPAVNPDATSRLYGALAAHAGISHLVSVDDPRVAADVIERTDGTRFAWLVSQADETLTVRPELADGLTLAPLDGIPLDGRATGSEVTIPPFGVSVLRLAPAGE